jgi:hypothetical protein
VGVRAGAEADLTARALLYRAKGKIAARVWEKEKRGLAHVDGVLPVSTPAEVAWAGAYVMALRELAPRYGFGFVDGWEKIGRRLWPGDQAGAYYHGHC